MPVGSEPVLLDPGESIFIAFRLELSVPANEVLTLYECVLQTPSVVGVGNCVAVTATAENLQRTNDVTTPIGPFVFDGTPKTTEYVFVALTEGAFRWNPERVPPPRRGDLIPGFDLATGRIRNFTVLDTFITPLSVTFR